MRRTQRPARFFCAAAVDRRGGGAMMIGATGPDVKERMDGMTNNDRLIRWIQRRAEGFRGDIAVIAAYGSYINGTANPRSDVDCYFVPKTERGGKFAATFILAGVGYDIFPMNWARLERIADLRDPLTPLVGDVRLLYCDTEADLERFGRLQQALRDNLNDPARARAAAKERYELARPVRRDGAYAGSPARACWQAGFSWRWPTRPRPGTRSIFTLA